MLCDTLEVNNNLLAKFVIYCPPADFAFRIAIRYQAPGNRSRWPPLAASNSASLIEGVSAGA
jgi:hypothetical protein